MEVFWLKHVKKSFGDLEVLKDITMSVCEGEAVSILGPSGSGKSTLLRCANLLETMDGGSLSYCGIEAAQENEKGELVYAKKKQLKEVRECFGLVFQNFNLFPHYTVMKNITDAPIHIQKRDKEEVYNEARELLKKMGLSDKENAYPHQLSGGQQQRIAIARALCMNPKILFFDEPTSALDPELTQEILKVLRNLVKEKTTMVIFTHEIEFAKNVSKRIIFMDGGKIVEEGTPEQVIDNPTNQRTREFLQKMK